MPIFQLAGICSKVIFREILKKANGFQPAENHGEKEEYTQGHKWQHRFWEHLLRDQADFNRYVDYIRLNPVKHGWVNKVRDWPYSSFQRYVEQGIYTEDWGSNENQDIDGVE